MPAVARPPAPAAGRRDASRRAPPSPRAESAVGVVHRRQRADAHRRRRAVLRRRVPAASISPSIVTIPIELRLAGVALGRRRADRCSACASRASRPGYGLSLQGAGAGILYLTTFAAFRLYDVLPAVPAFALLVARRRARPSWLAMRADSQPLAGARDRRRLPRAVPGRDDAGEPRAAVRLLRGAERRDLRARAGRARGARSTSLGFVFTFVLGLVLGRSATTGPSTSRPSSRSSSLFFVVLRRDRDPLRAARRARGEGARSTALLVFGVPLVGFALQAALVRDIALRRRVERARAGGRLRAAVRSRCAARAEPGLRAAVARVPRARGHLRDDRDSVRARRSLDVRVVGARGGRRVLDRLPAEAAARARRSRCCSQLGAGARVRRRRRRHGRRPAVRSTRTSSARC